MERRSPKHFILCLTCWPLWFCCAFPGKLQGQERVGHDYGIYFYSGEVGSDQRTSLDLTPEGSLMLTNGFTMQFQLRFREGDGYYGNILTIVTKEKDRFDLVSNLSFPKESNEAVLALINKDSTLLSFTWADLGNKDFGDWMEFELRFDMGRSTVSLRVDDKTKTQQNIPISQFHHFDVLMGKIDPPLEPVIDVSPMVVRNIKILDGQRRIIRDWTMDRHTTTGWVLDNIERSPARATHAKWLMDRHLKWSFEGRFTMDNLVGAAYAEELGKLFFVNNKAIYTYTLENKQLDTLYYRGQPLFYDDNNLIYHPYFNELWSYSIDNKRVSRFDFAKEIWSEDEPYQGETDYWQATKIISPKDSSLLAIGGYGHYEYKSTVNQYVPESDSWDEYELSDFPPRYLCASGLWGTDRILLFGGFGTKTGNQINLPKSYEDLYVFDLNTKETRKLWNVEPLSNSFHVPVNSLIVDSNNEGFYTLVFDNTKFNTFLKVAHFGINEFNIETFNDSVPYDFHDIRSYADLALSPDGDEFWALTIYKDNVELHSRAFPPLGADDVFQHMEERVKNDLTWLLWLFVPFTVIVVSGFYLLRRKRQNVKLSGQKVLPPQLEYNIGPKTNEGHKETSTIKLFGGFTVIALDGDDITGQFTPTLKQLFLLIYFSKVNNGKGITSIELREILWPDKDNESARNNRNVNISKLRFLLEKVGSVEITHKNTHWHVHFGPGVLCDFDLAKKLLNRLDHGISQEELRLLFQLLDSGELCPEIQTDWMEKFKEEFNTELIDRLEAFSINQTDPKMLLSLADTILKNAPLNEYAIQIKCRTLFKMGKKSLAKKAYDLFNEEHLRMLELPYDIPFTNLVQE